MEAMQTRGAGGVEGLVTLVVALVVGEGLQQWPTGKEGAGWLG
jgi:hypothetical protein